MGRWDWLGVREQRWTKKSDEEVRPAKTAWDWLQIAVVPAMLAIIALAFTASQASRDRSREDRRVKEEQRLADQRIRHDRAIAKEARLDATLEGYLARMNDLVLDRHLLRSARGDVVQQVARTLTLTTLRRLDANRKREVVLFLNEAHLLKTRQEAHVELDAADLRGANLTDTYFRGVDFSDADLRGARFDGTQIRGSNFSQAELAGASFRGGQLDGTFFGPFTDLTGAAFDRAALGWNGPKMVDFSGACLNHSSFVGTEFGSGGRRAYVDFRWAEGRGVNFARSRGLSRARIGGANLFDLRLDGVRDRPREWGPTGVRRRDKDSDACRYI
jgi:uncharacterized protein YjbI with pentapeptide repeats